MVAYRDLFADYARNIMAKARVITDDQRGMVRVARREEKVASAVDRDIVADYDLALTLDPMKEHPRMEIAPIPSAVSLEKRLAAKHADQEVEDLPHAQQEHEHWQRNQARRRNAKVHNEPVQPPRRACRPMI
ncbi:MAG: hypothetical protein LLG20_11405 [Acidobacteriales bacterium]|nr:hypothetical protein [Terriglobales bacterium]